MLKNIGKIFSLLILTAGLFWAQSSYAAGWVSQFSGTVGHLKDINMVNHKVGFAVGELKILKTTNSGNNWTIVYNASGETYNAISMVSETVGWAVGNSGKILKTSDGGDSWQPQTSGVTVNLNDVSFWSSTEGLAVGAGGTVLRTFDGGVTWTPLSSGVVTDLYAITWGASLI